MRGIWRSRRIDEGGRSLDSPAYFSIIDPGTSSLRLLVVEASDGQGTVWGWDEGPGWAGADPQRLLATCREMLGRAEGMAQERAGRRIVTDQMLVGLPGSRLRGGSWAVDQRRSQPERPVEERELRVLLGRALRLTINQLRQTTGPSTDGARGGYATAGGGEPRWLLVDATTVELRVDGRRVTDPVGFRGQEIGATVFAALAQAETIDVWRLVATQLEFLTLILTSTPLALTLGLSESQGVLLDVGGETTDLTLWQGGRPVALDSLPIGSAALTRSLMRTWDLSFERAERLKWAHASGRLSDADQAKIREAMFPALRNWLEETEAALVRLNQRVPLPQRIVMLGGGSSLSEVTEAARALAWSERLSFLRYPQVERLRATDVQGVVNRTDTGHGTGDVPALALASWAGRQTGSLDRPARILGELCQDGL